MMSYTTMGGRSGGDTIDLGADQRDTAKEAIPVQLEVASG